MMTLIHFLAGGANIKLKGTNYHKLLLLINSFMDIKSWLVIPHFIEKVLDFKFVKGYLCIECNALVHHA